MRAASVIGWRGGDSNDINDVIDDAANWFRDRFYESESVFSAMDSLKRYIKKEPGSNEHLL